MGLLRINGQLYLLWINLGTNVHVTSNGCWDHKCYFFISGLLAQLLETLCHPHHWSIPMLSPEALSRWSMYIHSFLCLWENNDIVKAVYFCCINLEQNFAKWVNMTFTFNLIGRDWYLGDIFLQCDWLRHTSVIKTSRVVLESINSKIEIP